MTSLRRTMLSFDFAYIRESPASYADRIGFLKDLADALSTELLTAREDGR